MNRKILFSLVSSAMMLALVVGATYAYFSDSSTSSDNTFSTGTLDLKLTDSNESGVDSVTASFGSVLAPGQCTGPQTLYLRNDGTIPADHAEVTVSNITNDANDNAGVDIDKFMKIQTLTYDGSDVLSQITDNNTTAFKDLDDWQTTTGALDNLSLTNIGSSHPLVLNVCLDASAGDTLQGDSVVSTFTVTLNQDQSQ